jgi:ATP-dependent DNA ligase
MKSQDGGEDWSRIPGGKSRWSTGKESEWVGLRPELVCEVEYDYFSQGRFRHGSKFLRWRPEKDPQTCTMDQVLPPRTRGKSLAKLFS